MTTPAMVAKVRRLAERVEAAERSRTMDAVAVRRLREIASEHGDARHVGWVFALYAPTAARRIAGGKV